MLFEHHCPDQATKQDLNGSDLDQEIEVAPPM